MSRDCSCRRISMSNNPNPQSSGQKRPSRQRRVPAVRLPVTGELRGRMANLHDRHRSADPWQRRFDHAAQVVEIPDRYDASRIIRMKITDYRYVRAKFPRITKTRWVIDASGDVFAPVAETDDAVSVGAILSAAKDGDLIDVTDAETLFTARIRRPA
ncbi:hypothetical protein CBM2626_A60327 [Cupriavidus taiwanensis]|nr:hypothetical protein CBM2626_A60327 [Cupriavidus taiwanensis]